MLARRSPRPSGAGAGLFSLEGGGGGPLDLPPPMGGGGGPDPPAGRGGGGGPPENQSKIASYFECIIIAT
jgi:hypothetical protein